ncbi:DUF5643 domain-containing protein [Paenibacillus sp. CN-4]|uniref:DUF5643 domain-containing protein n=1 Tax=Paenibacillus nanchangensis TaxID=3348343 RepID=UPI003979A47B
MNRPKENVSSIAQLLKKSSLTLTAVAVLGGVIPCAGTLTEAKAAALDEALKPAVPYSNLLTAATGAAGNATPANLSVTHDGVTLRVTHLIYDKTRLSFVIERQGANLPDDESVVLLNEEIEKNKKGKGYIKRPTLFIDGQELGALGAFGDNPKIKSSSRYEIGKKADWPDQFELTIRVQVTGVKEAFEFKVPVNIDEKSILVKPNLTKKHKQFSYTVKELYMSSSTTQLVIDSTGKVPATSKQAGKYIASMMYYDIVDDQGNLIKQQMFPYYNFLPKTKYHIDEMYNPVKGTPKYLTIKPFTLTVNKKDWSVVGQTKNSVGTKTYWKELEMKIPLDKAKN